jgi:hypothetical protein
MILDDIRYFRAWPDGKEVISLSSPGRILVTISSRDAEGKEDYAPAFDPTLDGYEWRVVAHALAETVLSYQKLCNEQADDLDRLKGGLDVT